MTKHEYFKGAAERLQIELLYYKKLAESAINYIDQTPCDPDIYPKQWEAWNKYQEILKEREND